MATVELTVTITTPEGMTAAESLRLFTEYNAYDRRKLENETRAQFAKRIVAETVANQINHQSQQDARAAATYKTVTAA